MPAERYMLNTEKLLRAFRTTASDKDFRIVEEDGHTILQWQHIGGIAWRDVLDLTPKKFTEEIHWISEDRKMILVKSTIPFGYTYENEPQYYAQFNLGEIKNEVEQSD